MAEETGETATTDPTTIGGAALATEPMAPAEGEGADAKLAQQVEITDAGPCRKHVKVTVERGAINTRLEERYTKLMVEVPAQINGFRIGKAPRKIVEKRYKGEVTQEVKTEVLMASLEQLADESTLSPLSPPELDPNSVVIPDSGDLVYEFNIEVRPEFDLPPYKNLKIKKPVHAFTEAEINAEAKRVLEPFGKVLDKPDGATVEMDDQLLADAVIKRGDEELNTVKDVQLKVEKRLALSDGVAENFGETLKGAKVGESRKVEITLSQDVADEAMRGTQVSATFTVKKIQHTQQAELTPELLENFDVRNAEQFRELVRKRLDRYLEYSQRQSARTQIMEALAKDTKFDLPRDLLLRQSRKTLQRRVMEMRSAGMSDEQIMGRQRVLEQDVVRSTAESLKEHFVLQKIAELEKLEIEDADVDDEVDRIADQSNESPRKVRARLERDELMEALATELLERKALEVVLSTAEYEEFQQNPLAQDDGDVATVEATASGEAPALPGEGGNEK